MNTIIKAEENVERRHFDAMAKIYEKNYGYLDKFTKYKIDKKVGKFVELLHNYFKSSKRIEIFEIGCGTGTYTIKYAQKLPNASIFATDISDGMIDVAKSRKQTSKNLRYGIASAYRTGLKNSSVDVVCGFYILHHLNSKEVIKEIKRILKPGGFVYFYEPNILNPVVFLIKSNKFIKKIVGDSSEEWAINPTKVDIDWKGFEKIEVKSTEFVWPVSFIPFGFKVLLDKLTDSLFTRIPGLNLIGGSVELFLKNEKIK